jgi:ketosteroid isomerase-like protein
MKIINCLSLLLLLGFTVTSQAQDHEQDRATMRAMLSDIEQALNAQDFDAVLKHVHEDAVITYYNAEVTQGHAAARDYYQRMIASSNAVVKEFSTKGEPSAPSIIYGNTAVAYGTTVEKYKLTGGLEFTLNGRWSTTLLKSDDEWKVVALHFSTNLFDNPLLNNAKRSVWISGSIAFVVGVLLMFGIGRLRARKA